MLYQYRNYCRKNAMLVPQAAAAGNHNQPIHRRVLRLPGGEYWWLNARKNVDLIYGNEFIIERPRVGGEGILVSRNMDQTSLVKRKLTRKEQTEALSVFGDSSIFPSYESCYGFEDLTGHSTRSTALLPEHCGTEKRVGWMQEEAYVDSESTEPRKETQMVLISKSDATMLAARVPDSPQHSPLHHPRRTMRIGFTCNICGHRNHNRPVNPLAWQRGSVFMRCEDCQVVHKLKDNLKIFHELSGEVFPPRHLRNAAMIEDILKHIKQKKQ